MRHLLTTVFTITALAACGQAPGEASGGAKITSSGAAEACHTRKTDRIGGPIALTNETGATVTQDTFKGRKTLVFFGFTYCPDVCPNTLYLLASALESVPAGKRPLTALIFVDPSRDTPEALRAYIHSQGFPADMTGLTGSEEDVRKAADAFAADYARIEDKDSQAGYTMQHTALVYLMDENWKLATFFTPEQSAADISRCLSALP